MTRGWSLLLLLLRNPFSSVLFERVWGVLISGSCTFFFCKLTGDVEVGGGADRVVEVGRAHL